jgi:hypothetical protein
MVFSVGNYIFNNEAITAAFEGFGYPGYLVYPLAAVKILGILAIWFSKNRSIKEWAYAGFFFDFVLAFFAHIMIADGQFFGAVIATVLLAASYFTWDKATA